MAQTNTLTLPTWATGSHYLIFRVDINEDIVEMVETNNTRVAQLAALDELPDLVPIFWRWQPPDSGGTVTIVYTVTNRSTAVSSMTWLDDVYLSTNNAWLDGSDAKVGSFIKNQTLPAGASYTQTNTTCFTDPTATNRIPYFYRVGVEPSPSPCPA